MQQIYRRTLVPKCDFNKVAKQNKFIEIALRHGCSTVNLLNIFRTLFSKKTPGGLLLDWNQNLGTFVWYFLHYVVSVIYIPVCSHDSYILPQKQKHIKEDNYVFKVWYKNTKLICRMLCWISSKLTKSSRDLLA